MEVALLVVVCVFVTWYLCLLTHDRFVLWKASRQEPQTAVNVP